MAEAKPINPSEAVQPSLFAPNELPDMPLVIAAAKVYLHTGKITNKDGQRAEYIVETFIRTGYNKLATARACFCSPNTIDPIFNAMEESGKLDGLKERLSKKLGLLAELSTEAAIDAVHAGRVPANALYPLIGVPLDKKAQMDGDATSRIEVTINEPVALGDLARYLASKGVAAPAIDVESTVSNQNSQ